MNHKQLYASGMPRIFDNTMRCMLGQCPRKLYYFLRRFDYPPGAVPSYFIWGRAFHQALREWYTVDITDPLERQRNAIAAGLILWEDEGGVDRANDTRDNLIAKLTRYFEENPFEEWEFVPHGDEAGFIYPISSDWEYAGAMDGYVNWPGKGHMVLEHKTTGSYITANYRQQWHFASQVLGYVWYLHQILDPASVYGAVVNMIAKPKKTPTSRWTTPEFAREHIRVLPYHLDEFQRDLFHQLNLFRDYWTDNYWPKLGVTDPAMCAGGPGKSPCLFRGICQTPIKHDEVDARNFLGIVESDIPWEPWKRQSES